MTMMTIMSATKTKCQGASKNDMLRSLLVVCSDRAYAAQSAERQRSTDHRFAPILSIGAEGLPGKIAVKWRALRDPEDATAGSALYCDLPRRKNAGHRQDGLDLAAPSVTGMP